MAKDTPKSKTAARTSGRKTPDKPTAKSKTKKQICIDLLKRPDGTNLKELQKATGWQPHSVRGFLSGTVKKMTDVVLVTEKDENGTRRYRIEKDGGAQA